MNDYWSTDWADAVRWADAEAFRSMCRYRVRRRDHPLTGTVGWLAAPTANRWRPR